MVHIPQIIDTLSWSVCNKEVFKVCTNFLPKAKILCPLSVLERVRIIEVFFGGNV